MLLFSKITSMLSINRLNNKQFAVFLGFKLLTVIISTTSWNLHIFHILKGQF